LKLLKLIYFI